MDLVQMYFSIRGRINRTTYWCAIFPLVVTYAVAEVMAESTNQATAGLGYLIMVSLIWPSLAVQTKRWHDRNKSGWWNLISLVPIVGPIWALVELGFLKGTDGTNRYDLRPVPRPSCDYGVRISHAEDAYTADPLGESEPVADAHSLSNSWRSR